MSDYKFKTQNIKGTPYVPVHERIKYLDQNYRGQYSIFQDEKYMPELNCWFVKTTLVVVFDGQERFYHGSASEVIGDSIVNKTSALENAVTSSIGKACAAMGIGIDTSMASYEEVNTAINQQEQMSANTQQSAEKQTYTAPATERQQLYHDLVIERVAPDDQAKYLDALPNLGAARLEEGIKKLKTLKPISS